MTILSFWLTVIGTVAGVVSMCIAWLDRRGPREPRQGPSRISRYFDFAFVLFLCLICVAVVVVDIGAFWVRFDVSRWGAVGGVYLNLAGMILFNSLYSQGHKLARFVYTMFCGLGVALWTGASIALWSA
ncbi:hypothetical protein ACWCPM_05565 [Streptomyces sp. NPDC002309]